MATFSPRRCCFTFLVAASWMLSFVSANQLDIVVSEMGSDGVSISLQGALDLESGATYLGDSPAVANMSPFIKLGHSDDGAGDFSLIDMQTSDTSYYALDDSESLWSFDCIKAPTDLFKFTNETSLANSIGFFVTKQAPSILVSKDGDYSNFDEQITVSVSSVESLGLVPDSTCTMEFGNNRIHVQVGSGGEDEDVSDLAPTGSPSLRSVGPKSDAPPVTDAPVDVTTPAPTTATPTAASCDWVCETMKFFGIRGTER